MDQLKTLAIGASKLDFLSALTKVLTGDSLDRKTHLWDLFLTWTQGIRP